MAPFHTAVDLKRLIDAAAGFAPGEVCAVSPCPANTRIRLTTTGPATNIYVNLIGRESAGTATVSPAEYSALVPSIKQGRKIGSVRNIDIAPTVMEILGVAPAPTVDGAVIPKLLRKDKD
jgi:hypothetical protein